MSDIANRQGQRIQDMDASLENLPQALAVIDNAWKRLCNIGWDDELLSRMSRAVSRIAGESNRNGYEEVARLSKTVQQVLARISASGSVPAEAEKHFVEARLEQLYAASRKLPDQGANEDQHQQQDETGDMVYVVDDDEYAGTYLTLILKSGGYRSRLFRSIQAFHQAFKENTPDIIIMDIVFPEGHFAGIDAINQLQAEMGCSIPIIFMSARTDATARIRALRAGGCAYIGKPVAPEVLLTTIENNASSRQRHKRALLIDDDLDNIERCRALLEKGNIDIASITDSLETIHEIEVFDPDVIVIDYDMPHCNGEELVRLLRQDHRYINLPVVMLISKNRPNIEADIMALGGIRFIDRAMVGDALLENVASSIRLSRRSKKRMLEVLKVHPRGLVNIGYFYSQLEAFIASLPDPDHDHALIYLAIDEPQKLRAKVGLKSLDALSKKIAGYLRSLMHENQLITQSTEFVYLLMLRFDGRQQLEQEIKMLLGEIAREEFIIRDIVTHVTASIGAICLNNEFGTVDAAVEIAEKASLTASQKGGNQYRIWTPTKKIDVDQQEVSTKDLGSIMREANIRVQYQPIVNIEESENVYEAYARYMDGDKVITPDMFMPYVRQHELQGELNRHVMARVLDELDDGGSYEAVTRRIIVKIEPENNSMMEFLIWLGKRFGQFKGSIRIILSFREEWVLSNKVAFEAFLNLSRKFRFGIAIEHAGQSNYSVDLVDVIQPVYTKLSSGFINQLLDESNIASKRKLKALLETGTKVVACSVENADTFARLMALGIHHFQGYFVQQPESGFNFEFTRQQI